MPPAEFEKTNWSWQLSQFRQQAGEWLELQLDNLTANLPALSVPGWSIDAPGIWQLFQILVWLLLGGCLLWLGWQLWQLIQPELKSDRSLKAKKLTVIAPEVLTVAAWLQRSQAHFRQSDYRSACRCLYLGMLQHLDDTKIATHQPSRTNREYLQLVQQLPQSQAYQTLIATHEQLCFGNSEILPETFEQCQQAYREIAKQ